MSDPITSRMIGNSKASMIGNDRKSSLILRDIRKMCTLKKLRYFQICSIQLHPPRTFLFSRSITINWIGYSKWFGTLLPLFYVQFECLLCQQNSE